MSNFLFQNTFTDIISGFPYYSSKSYWKYIGNSPDRNFTVRMTLWRPRSPRLKLVPSNYQWHSKSTALRQAYHALGQGNKGSWLLWNSPWHPPLAFREGIVVLKSNTNPAETWYFYRVSQAGSGENWTDQRNKLVFRFQISTVRNFTDANLPPIPERFSLPLHRLTRPARPPMSCLKQDRQQGKGNLVKVRHISPCLSDRVLRRVW